MAPRSRFRIALVATFVIGVLAGAVHLSGDRGRPLSAGTALRLDVDGLVAGSADIIEARVLGGEAYLEPDGRAVTTEWHLDVERSFLGGRAGSMVLRWPGGTLPDGSGMLLAGMPRLASGERVILFLTRASGDAAWQMPVGLAQGKWTVRARPDGRKLVERDVFGLALVEGGVVTHGAHVVRDYAEVIAEIHAALARRGAEAR